MSDTPGLVLPTEPLPVRLMNTLWSERGRVHDDLATVEGVAAWFAAVGMPATEVREADAEAARMLRDAVRAVAAVPTHDEGRPIAPQAEPHEALDVLEALAEAAPRPDLVIDGGRIVRRPAAPSPSVETSIAQLAAEAIEFISSSEANDLRACYGPRCTLFFVKDHPRREWCDGACGTRARAARHYAKRTAVKKS